jgi:hypothetical protein
LEFLRLTIIVTSFAFGVDESETVVLLLVLLVLDGVMPSRELGAQLVVSLHHRTDVASRGLGAVVVQVVSCEV